MATLTLIAGAKVCERPCCAGRMLRVVPRDRRLAMVVALVAWPQTITLIVAGNPLLWMATFLALGLSPLVLLKPTLAPFALVGVRTGRWWAGWLVLVIATVPFVALIPDYLAALRNAQDSQGILFILGNVPLMVVGWLARASAPATRTGS